MGPNCVEVIRFSVCPELIASRLFCERLGDNECLVVTGFERFSSYTDFGWKIEVNGGYDDRTPIDPDSGHRLSRLVLLPMDDSNLVEGKYSNEWRC